MGLGMRRMSARLGLVVSVLLAAQTTVSCAEEGHGKWHYPEGPYGTGVGDIIQNLRLSGLDGSEYRLASVYESPDAVAVLYITATWCFTSGPEITWLNGEVAANKGITALTVVVENETYEAASVADGVAFRDAFGVEFPTVVDTNEVMLAYREAAAIPLNLIVRKRDMRIVHRAQGFEQSSLEQAISTILQEGS